MRSRHRTPILTLGLVAALGLSAPAGAQQHPEFSFTGVVTIQGVDAESGMLTVRDGLRQREIPTGPKTLVQDASGDEIPLTALEPWDRVVVDARREMEGQRTGEKLVADRVQLVIGSVGSQRADELRHRRDAAVRDRVVERLAASRHLQGSDLWVLVADGRVTLRGLVADEGARKRAVGIARRTPGVRAVSSELDTDPAILEWARIQKRDDALAREVAERLVTEVFPGADAEPEWLFGWEVEGESFELDVDVDMGTVTLRGTVPSPAEAERAAALARRTPGVRDVRSHLSSDG